MAEVTIIIFLGIKQANNNKLFYSPHSKNVGLTLINIRQPQ